MFNFFKKKEKTYFVTWINHDQETMKTMMGTRSVISAKRGTALADECIALVHQIIPNAIIVSIQPLG